jgi:hypothetical protein
MNPGAGVTSLEALHDWYAALAAFRSEAGNALTSLTMSLQHAVDWLDDQRQYWQRQIRECDEEVTQAKTELMNREFTDFLGNKLDTTLQKENLRKARARLAFAEERLESVHRWSKQIPLEIRETYDGPVRQLGFLLETDVPRGLAVLARQLVALEQYANLRCEAAPAAVAPVPKTDKEKP